MSSNGFRLKPSAINETYGRHNGQTMLVLGCSASVDEVELALVQDIPKVSINRGLRAIECEYCVFSDPDVFQAIKQDVKLRYGNKWPEMLIFRGVLGNWRSNGLRLDGKKYYEMRLGYKDGWKNQEGYYKRAPMPDDNPFKKYYAHNGTPYNTWKNPKGVRATEPGCMAKDGTFLHSTTTAAYAIEWAFRMLVGDLPSRIILLGIDICYKRVGGKDLTYMKKIDTRSQQDKTCRIPFPDLFVPQLGRSIKYFAEHNVELINCSPWEGPLDEFVPRADLRTLKGLSK